MMLKLTHQDAYPVVTSEPDHHRVGEERVTALAETL
jgi:hypothetical protein